MFTVNGRDYTFKDGAVVDLGNSQIDVESSERNDREQTGQTNQVVRPPVLDADGNEVPQPENINNEVSDNTEGSDDTRESTQTIVSDITAPQGTEPGEVFTVNGKDYTVNSNGDTILIGNAQIEDESQTVESSSLSQDQIEEIYGPDARTSTNNAGQTQIIVPGVDGAEDQVINMPDAVAQYDNRVAEEEQQQQEVNANAIGLRRRDLNGLPKEELDARLNETTLTDKEKLSITRKWNTVNGDSFFEQIFQRYRKGDGKGAALALKDAAALLKSSGGISSLVAGFMGAKAAKKGLEEVSVPELNGMTSAFKMYSQQQKALSESGLSYAERRTIEQGIDETYEKGIQNLRVGTGGDRAKFLAGTGALDYNRQTSLLKTAALEDEARRQNRDSYGKLLQFEAQQNREKDLFTKSREYNQELSDKAMFQNTASSAFKHVFDNIRFGQDYKPLMDAMGIRANQIQGKLNLNDKGINTPPPDNIEQTDPNEQIDETP